MKYTRPGRRALASLLGILVLGGARTGDQTQPAVEPMGVKAASDYVAQHNDALIMDVRTPAEFDMSHITGAINANVQSDDFELLVAALDTDKIYLVHCTRNPENGRSARALETL